MNIDFEKASFKDFENIPDLDPYSWASLWTEYVADRTKVGQFNYRQQNLSGCGPQMTLDIKGIDNTDFVSLVSNDYLGFTQHPKVKAAAIAGIEKFGSGAGASPAIGGHYSFHQELEDKIAAFFKGDSAIVFTTGYNANSSSLQALLKKEDLAILDIAVHASVYEGCQLTNVKTFPHNNVEALENVLKNTEGKYRTRMVVIDGVYSQDGDLAPLNEIIKLTKHYAAYLVVDDAHGTGVISKTGRGVIELHNLSKEVDIITGTFSKTFAHVGGYLVASPELVKFLKFQSRQHVFSATLSPASACIVKAIDLVDEEPVTLNAKLVADSGGDSVAVIIKVRMAPGWHIYAYVPENMPYILTECLLEPDSNVKKVGTWIKSIPQASTTDKGVMIYEDVAVFTHKLKKTFKQAKGKISTGLYYQTCNLQQCLPPDEVKVELAY